MGGRHHSVTTGDIISFWWAASPGISNLRYPSDLTENEWKLIEPLIPPAKRGGDKRTVNIREVVSKHPTKAALRRLFVE